jgi:hypothetical protein
MYLHMLIPAKDNSMIETTGDDSGKFNDVPKPKTYYEIGCKIFEINKIYK